MSDTVQSVVGITSRHLHNITLQVSALLKNWGTERWRNMHKLNRSKAAELEFEQVHELPIISRAKTEEWACSNISNVRVTIFPSKIIIKITYQLAVSYVRNYSIGKCTPKWPVLLSTWASWVTWEWVRQGNWMSSVFFYTTSTWITLLCICHAGHCSNGFKHIIKSFILTKAEQLVQISHLLAELF